MSSRTAGRFRPHSIARLGRRGKVRRFGEKEKFNETQTKDLHRVVAELHSAAEPEPV